ncbi:pep-cterm sorting domain-containing protein [Anaeramoeba ignava]|uniref:Pep-cterm sorting domain-containing protein n=1 Tax=Anaeramoeba ignava TaxID=1746090 RepID=A0A9Q0RDC9_ANAIG|nr:pep-cterm sorting domain-containing protein [Anaeramoeba ignava]
METYSNLEKLSNDLKNLFQNQNENENEEESYFDFEIICEQNKTSFKTHKSILSSRSEYFKTLFKSKMKEYQENKLILKDNLQFETVIDVLKLCESMKINELLESCYKFIFKNLEKFIKTSFFLELEENHLNLILSNDNILINEFKIFQSIIKWGKHKSNINQIKENEKLEKEEKEKIQDQISNIIQKIRFIDFSKKELTDTLKQNLIPNQISQKLNNLLKLKTNKNKRNKRIN